MGLKMISSGCEMVGSLEGDACVAVLLPRERIGPRGRPAGGAGRDVIIHVINLGRMKRFHLGESEHTRSLKKTTTLRYEARKPSLLAERRTVREC